MHAKQINNKNYKYVQKLRIIPNNIENPYFNKMCKSPIELDPTATLIESNGRNPKYEENPNRCV